MKDPQVLAEWVAAKRPIRDRLNAVAQSLGLPGYVRWSLGNGGSRPAGWMYFPPTGFPSLLDANERGARAGLRRIAERNKKE